jgi:GLPGLI family protein
MKQVILALAVIYPFLLFGQTSGEVTYNETVKIQIELPEGMEQFKDKIPSSQTLHRVLLFNQEATIYKDMPIEESGDHEINMSDEGGGMQIKMDFTRPDNQMYSNVKSGKTLEKRDFMDKKFLIEGTAKRYKWQMTTDQKTILDYTCQKAIYQDTSQTIIAWFTTQIPVSAGPSSYSGLPGMILEMNIDDGQRTIQATNVVLKELEKNAIEIPKKGKKVTEEEFNKIVAEKTAEMQEQYGGSGNVIIKTRGGN